MKTITHVSASLFIKAIFTRKIYLPLFAILLCFSNELFAGIKPSYKHKNSHTASAGIKHQAARKRSVPNGPLVSYSSPQSFVVNVPITPLAPTSSRVAAPGYSSIAITLGSGFSSPAGVAVDASGNVFVADEGNNQIKDIPPGNGTPVASGYTFDQPVGVAVDAAGNVYVADFSNNTVEELFPSQDALLTSPVNFIQPSGVAVDVNGNVYVADEGQNAVMELQGGISGTPVNIGSGFSSPAGVAVDGAGNVYIADYGNNEVKEILAGTKTPIIIGSGFSRPNGVAVDNQGNVFVADEGNSALKEIPAGNGATITIHTGFDGITGVAVDNLGNLYTANSGSNTINEIGRVGGYYATTSLPPGLSLNGTTGVISGTPTVVNYPALYTIVAYNGNGSTSASLTIRITSVPPPTNSYTSPQTYVAGTAITPLSPTGSGVGAQGYDSNIQIIGSGFVNPYGIATDAAGNVYVVDESNNLVKEIPPGNNTQIILGSGFSDPTGIAVDAAGNVYVADTGSGTIKEIPAGNGPVTVLASGFTDPIGVAVDAAGNVYVSDEASAYDIKKIPVGSGTWVVLATGFDAPSGLAIDALGNIYVADTGDGMIKEIPAGSSTPIVISSGFDQPAGVAVDAFGNLFVADLEAPNITEIPAGNGTPVTIGQGVNVPIGIAADGFGNIFVSNYQNNTVVELTPTGGYYLSNRLPAGLTLNQSTGIISGTPAAASAAANFTISAYNAGGVASSVVNITVTPFNISYTSPDTYTKGAAITPLAPSVSGAIPTPGFSVTVGALGSGFTTPAGVAIDAAGDIYVADAAHNEVKMMPPGGGTPVVVGSGFTGPAGIAVDALGNLYISDTGNNLVKEIAAGSSSITVLGSGFSSPYGIAVDAAGDVFVADYGNNAIKEIPAGSGTPVIVGSGFTHPLGVTVDAAGNLYVTDSGNGAVKKIAAGGGSIVTLSSGLSLPFGIAIDPSGNLYVSDRTTSKVYTLPSAGGALVAIGSGFSEPSGLALDAAGNVYVADQASTALKEVKPTGGYYLSAVLPLGLSFNNSTGVISGTPAVLSAAKTYTVTAYNTGLSGQGTVNIAVATPAVGLAGLKISNGTLSPVFATATTGYTASVGNSITSVTVTPTVAGAGSTITVNGAAVTSGSASGAIALGVGANTISTVVTTGSATETYTVTVTRAPATNAKLSYLGLSQVVLSPSFVNAITSYTASVVNTITATSVQPIEVGPGATIAVNGVAVASGGSTLVALNVGANTINTVVTAQDGVTQLTYTVVVTRAPSAAPTLSNLALSTGTLSPAFATSQTSYTEAVGNSVTSITETPTTTSANATVTVNGIAVTSGSPSGAITLVAGANTINTVVTNGGATQTYTVTVTRAPASNAKLSYLGLSQVVLSPAFVNAVTSYTASVAGTVTSTNVEPIEVGPGATIKVNGVAVASGATTPVALSVGANTINTVVTAQDGVTQLTYTVVVTRAPSAIATLANITLNSGTLSPAFTSTKTSYTAAAGNTLTSITETPVTTDPTATVTVNGTAVTSGSPSQAIPLSVGANTITTVVTAGNGTTTDTYTVTVTRAPSSNAKLSYLGLSKVVLSPAFATATTSYTASVVNGIASTNVEGITVDPTATIEVNGVAVASGSSTPIALNVGSNTINTVVTAQDGVTQITYTVTVTRAAPSGAYVVFDPVSVEKPADSPQLADDGIVVHQGVSPNGDGIDDYLQIDGITNYPDNKLTIINRSGMLVYEAKGYDNSSRMFDGHSNKNGQMQLPGTYFYSLDYTANGVFKHKTGYLVLKY